MKTSTHNKGKTNLLEWMIPAYAEEELELHEQRLAAIAKESGGCLWGAAKP